MSTLHVRRLPPTTTAWDEPIAFVCLEKPCVIHGVVLKAVQLDKHAEVIHGSEHIEIVPDPLPLFDKEKTNASST